MNKARMKAFVLALTFGRIPLVGVFAVLAAVSTFHEIRGLGIVAFVFLVMSAATDLLDGHLARK